MVSDTRIVWITTSKWDSEANEKNGADSNDTMFQGKPTRDHHMETLKAEKKVFIDGQWLHRELTQIMQHLALQLFVFFAQKLHPVCHTSVSKRQNFRSQKARDFLLKHHLGTMG